MSPLFWAGLGVLAFSFLFLSGIIPITYCVGINTFLGCAGVNINLGFWLGIVFAVMGALLLLAGRKGR